MVDPSTELSRALHTMLTTTIILCYSIYALFEISRFNWTNDWVHTFLSMKWGRRAFNKHIETQEEDESRVRNNFHFVGSLIQMYKNYTHRVAHKFELKDVSSDLSQTLISSLTPFNVNDLISRKIPRCKIFFFQNILNFIIRIDTLLQIWLPM